MDMFIHPAARVITGLVVGIALALGLTTIGTTIAHPEQAYASTTAGAIAKLPNGNTVSLPSGTIITVGKSTTKAKAAVTQAKKFWKTSGLEAYGKKLGWSVSKKWTTKTANKAVQRVHFYYNVGTTQRFMDVVQTTYKKSGKWTAKYTSGQDGKTYAISGFKATLRKSAPSKK